MTQADALQNAAKLFSQGDADLLRRHLQALVDVEFLTIPLYLTATYSFTDAALAYSPDGGKSTPLYDAQQELLSVAVQEMLHLQLACNLCNSFGVEPKIPQLNVAPGQVITVPHLEPVAGRRLTTTIGNLPAVIDALIAIEKPADSAFPPPNERVIYPSIADLYHATLDLLNHYLRAYGSVDPSDDPHFQPNHFQVSYATFKTTYPHIPTIAVRKDVATEANAITDQGEGGLIAAHAGGAFRSAPTAGGVRPAFQPVPGSRFARWGAKSHYTRFVHVKTVIAKYAAVSQGTPLPSKPLLTRDEQPMFYQPNGQDSGDLPKWAPQAHTLQQCARDIWSYLIDTMQAGFADGSLVPDSGSSAGGPAFNDAMLAFKYITPLLWQRGHVIGYQYRSGVGGVQAQKAMDTADPLSLFHWDQKTAKLRAQWKADGTALNACQGLNECSERGWGGIAAAAGAGACATADMHTCVGNNACSSQGGCAFLSSTTKGLLPPAEQWVPSQNADVGSGGCQTPISTHQVFDRTAASVINAQKWDPSAKAALLALVGQSVWQQARAILAKKLAPDPLPAPASTTQYDGAARRAAVAPSSK